MLRKDKPFSALLSYKKNSTIPGIISMGGVLSTKKSRIGIAPIRLFLNLEERDSLFCSFRLFGAAAFGYKKYQQNKSQQAEAGSQQQVIRRRRLGSNAPGAQLPIDGGNVFVGKHAAINYIFLPARFYVVVPNARKVFVRSLGFFASALFVGR